MILSCLELVLEQILNLRVDLSNGDSSSSFTTIGTLLSMLSLDLYISINISQLHSLPAQERRLRSKLGFLG